MPKPTKQQTKKAKRRKQNRAIVQDECMPERTLVVMFALVNGTSNKVSYPLRPLFIRGPEILPAQVIGSGPAPKVAFHSDVIFPKDEGGHICIWQNGMRVCPPH